MITIRAATIEEAKAARPPWAIHISAIFKVRGEALRDFVFVDTLLT